MKFNEFQILYLDVVVLLSDSLFGHVPSTGERTWDMLGIELS